MTCNGVSPNPGSGSSCGSCIDHGSGIDYIDWSAMERESTAELHFDE